MVKVELLKIEITSKSAELAREIDAIDDIGLETTLSDYAKEYTEQLEDGSYLTHLRMWLGYMIEQGNKKAVDIMKNLIKYRLATR